MDKSKINLVIDALMFLCVMAIIGIGMLMKFVLLPGKEIVAVYGKKVNLFLLGMDRHEWGNIHLAVVYAFLGLLTLHIILHWKMIVTSYRRLIGSKVVRCIIVLIIVSTGIFLVAFPWILEPEVKEKDRRDRYRTEHNMKN
jgi:hypothetical protein